MRLVVYKYRCLNKSDRRFDVFKHDWITHRCHIINIKYYLLPYYWAFPLGGRFLEIGGVKVNRLQT